MSIIANGVNNPKVELPRPNPEILAIIPARGGSKGVPRKNIQMLGGKPLIAWTIAIALGVKNIGRVIVSTEDDEIAEIAVKYGAEVPFMRPKRLADDDSIVGHVCSYTLHRLQEEERYSPGGYVILYPTQPFRRLKTITMLVEKILNGHQNVNTYTVVDSGQSSFFRLNSKGALIRLNVDDIDPADREYLAPSGYFIGVNRWPSHYQRQNYIHCLSNPIEEVDIDYPQDMYLAEEIVKHNLFKYES